MAEQKNNETSPKTEEPRQNRTLTGNTEATSALSDVINPKQYFGVLLQYWWLILLLVLVGTAAGAAYCIFSTPLYRASCRFELFQDPRLQITEDPGQRSNLQKPISEELQRQIVIMESGVLHERVMEQLRPQWSDEISSRNMRPEIEIQRVRESPTMVDIKVDAVNKKYARKYLNQMLEAYKQLRREEILQSNDKTLSNLRDELEDVKRELQAAQDAMAQFRKKHNITYTQAKSWYDEQFLNNLIQRQNSLKMEKTMLESRFAFLSDADAPTIQAALNLTLQTQAAAGNISGSPEQFKIGDTGNTDVSEIEQDYQGEPRAKRIKEKSSGLETLQWSEQTEWQKKQSELMRLQSEYEEKLETYKKEHPKMVELQKDIDAAKRDLKLAGKIALRRLKARYEAVKIELEAVDQASSTWRQELELSTEERAEYARLQSKVDRLKTLHDRVYQRILDSSIVNADALFSRLIEPVRTTEFPVKPAKAKIMILALLASLGLGTGGAFMLDYFDTRFLDVLAIEEKLKIPYISGIPNWRRVKRDFSPKKSSIIVSHDKGDTATETYRALRSGLEYVTEEHPSYAMLFTSGEEGEGKSMTVMNVGILSAWSNKKVLLVDGDMRRGVCHDEINANRHPGLCELFLGEYADWREVVQKTDYENLDFISSGRYRNEIPEMLSATRIRKLIDEWRKEYDLILMDSAPVGRVADTTLFARACDGVVMVVKHGSSSFASVRHAVHRLLDANIIGFCLNNIELGQRKYSYYRKYGGYYYGRYAYTYGGYYSGHDYTSEDSNTTEDTTSQNS